MKNILWIPVTIVSIVLLFVVKENFNKPDLMVHWSANLFTSILSVTNQGDYQIIVKKIKVNNHYIVPQNNPVSIETGESFTEIPYKGPEPVKVEVETDQGIYTQKMGETKYYNN